MQVFNIFSDEERFIYLLLKILLAKYFKNKEIQEKYKSPIEFLIDKLKLKKDEIEDLIQVFINTEIDQSEKLREKYSGVLEKNFKLEQKDEAIKRKGRLPSRRVQVKRKRNGVLEKYQTTVYYNPDTKIRLMKQIKLFSKNDKNFLLKILKNSLKDNFKSSYDRFQKSIIYKKFKDLFDTKYKPLVEQAIHQGNFELIQNLFEKFYLDVDKKSVGRKRLTRTHLKKIYKNLRKNLPKLTIQFLDEINKMFQDFIQDDKLEEEILKRLKNEIVI